MSLLTFKQAVKALGSADLIIVQDKDSSDRAVATFVGWEDEGDEESDYIIGTEGWGDTHINRSQKIEREGNVIKPSGACVVLELYKKMK